MSGDAPILYDWSGKPTSSANAPITSRPAQALTSPQGGMLTLGSDYATAPNAQAPKVDALGQQYTALVSTTGVQVPVAVNSASLAASSFGMPALGYDASTSPGTWRPIAVNSGGYPVNAVAYMATLVGLCPAVVSGTTNGKSMISVWNGGTSVLRLCAIYAVCPPQLTVSGVLTAVQQTYNQVLMGGYRISAAPTGGTAGTVANYDAADTIDSKVVFASGATITGEASTPHIIADAAYNPSYPLLYREDAASKEIVIPPSSGFHLRLYQAPTGSVVFQMRMVLTQAAS